MQASDLKPASAFALKLGIKCIVYGPPGSGKTPILSTAPRPVLLATEPGLLSMKNSNVPTWIGSNKKLIDEFFLWFFNSNESKNYDTLGLDSASGMCDIALSESTSKHGLAQYGDMADYVWPYMKRLYWLSQKHTYIVCREELTVDGKRRPSFPGQQLNRDIPHLYDCILRLAKTNVPNQGDVLAFQCNGSYDIVARNRVSCLEMFEPPDFGALVRKAMQ